MPPKPTTEVPTPSPPSATVSVTVTKPNPYARVGLLLKRVEVHGFFIESVVPHGLFEFTELEKGMRILAINEKQIRPEMTSYEVMKLLKFAKTDVTIKAERVWLPSPPSDENEKTTATTTAASEKNPTLSKKDEAPQESDKAKTDDKQPVLPGGGFPFDSSLLETTDQEKEWALAIKGAIKSLPDLDMPSDFMLVHLGIAGKGDVEWAIDRAYKMQQVREEYNICLTYEEGKKAVRELLDLAPDDGMIIAFNFDPHSGEGLAVLDARWRMKECWTDRKKMETTLRGCHYFCYANMPSFPAIRNGIVHAVEFEGYKLGHGMMDFKEAVTLTNTTHGAFPTVLKQVRFYNTPTLANLLLQLVAPFIPTEVADKHKVGCKFHGGTLNKFYLIPTREESMQRAYINICSGLKIRFESEKAFKLED